jgi:hypothetical protein
MRLPRSHRHSPSIDMATAPSGTRVQTSFAGVAILALAALFLLASCKDFWTDPSGTTPGVGSSIAVPATYA